MQQIDEQLQSGLDAIAEEDLRQDVTSVVKQEESKRLADDRSDGLERLAIFYHDQYWDRVPQCHREERLPGVANQRHRFSDHVSMLDDVFRQEGRNALEVWRDEIVRRFVFDGTQVQNLSWRSVPISFTDIRRQLPECTPRCEVARYATRVAARAVRARLRDPLLEPAEQARRGVI